MYVRGKREERLTGDLVKMGLFLYFVSVSVLREEREGLVTKGNMYAALYTSIV